MSWIRAVVRRPLALLAAVACAAGVYALAGFVVLPYFARPMLEKKLGATLHRNVTVAEMRVNPFVLSVELRGVRVDDRETGTLFTLDRLFANAQLASLVRRGLVLRQLTLDGPALHLLRRPDERYNISDLWTAPAEPAPAPAEASSPPRYSLNNIEIRNGSIDFDDRPADRKHTVRDLALGIPFLSNLPYAVRVDVQPTFRATVNGSPFAVGGKTQPFSETRTTTFELKATGVDLPFYYAYVPPALRPRVAVAGGRMDAAFTLAFEQPASAPARFTVAGTSRFHDVALRDVAGRDLLALPALDVTLAPSNVLQGQVVLAKIAALRPRYVLRRDARGELNAFDFLPPEPAPAPAAPPGGTTSAFEITDIGVTDGVMLYEDETLAPPFRTALHDVTFAMHGFSTAPNRAATMTAAATSEAHEGLRHDGTFTFEPRAVDATLTLTGVPITRYRPYYAATLPVEIGAGTLGLALHYRFWRDAAGAHVALSEGEGTLDGARVARRGHGEFLRAERLSFGGLALDPETRKLALANVGLRRAALAGERDTDGIDLAHLGAAPAAAAPPAPPPHAGADAAPTWDVTLGRLALERCAVKFTDWTRAVPVTVIADPIDATADGLSSARGREGRLAARATVAGGTLSLAGPVAPVPGTATLALEAKAIDLVGLQPYVTDVLRVIVDSGTFSAKGALTVAEGADGTPVVSYAGDASVDRFASADLVREEEMLRWGTLWFGGIDTRSTPFNLRIAEIALSDYFARVAVAADGSLNLRSLWAGAAPAAPAEPEADEDVSIAPVVETVASTVAPAPASSDVSIDRVSVQGGTIRYTDDYVKPHVAATLDAVAGRVSGLSSIASSAADVDLRGKLSDGSPLEITGRLNPLAGRLFLDLKGVFRNVDLSPLSPYSGKYAGYAIEKGKLSMDLEYRVKDGKLDAQNKLVLDQFTFGEKVDSPDATHLPVRLAVSLLKDREGKIDLDIPVTGSLDDPKFSMWRIVLKILKNLLVRVATSPFALLGKLGGRGEELSYVEFAAGRALLAPEAQAKLKDLAKVLGDRPNVKLELSGFIDREADREGLRTVLFERKLKQQKLRDIARRPDAPTNVDDVVVEPTEYTKYLLKAYRKEPFPKPRTVIGTVKELPVPEMEKLMLTNTPVEEADLRRLAADRATAVLDFLVKGAQVPAARVFLVEPKSIEAAARDKAGRSRVDFVLK